MPRSFPLMIFAAGFGSRMRELTADRPKPLIPVLGRTLLDRALDLAKGVAAAPVVVNTHYLGHQIANHLTHRPDILLSPELDGILETGGGLRKALPLLGSGPVMTLNPDAVWIGDNPLEMLANAWDPVRMDALLLVQDVALVRGRKPGRADFTLAPDGRISRANGGEGALYLGAQILLPEGLADIQDRAFSLNRLWDRIGAEGRLYGLPYAGAWCDVGSPEGLWAAEAMLA